MKLKVNFAAGEYKKVYGVKSALFAFCFFLVILSYLEVRAYNTNIVMFAELEKQKEYAAAQEKKASLEISKQGLSMEQFLKELPRFKVEARSINEIITKKRFLWTTFLSSLESLVPDEVRIEKISTNFSKRQVQIEGRTVAMKDITALVKAMEDSAIVSEPFLKENSTNKDDTIQFTIGCSVNIL